MFSPLRIEPTKNPANARVSPWEGYGFQEETALSRSKPGMGMFKRIRIATSKTSTSNRGPSGISWKSLLVSVRYDVLPYKQR
jgi:hypothetical protein